MNFYKGKENDAMDGHFRYVKEKGDSVEKHKFAPLIMDGREVCCGFVESGLTKVVMKRQKKTKF